MPKGIMGSAVPLPCFFDVVKSQRVAGKWPQLGTKSCRMGKNSLCPSVHLSICASNCPFIHLSAIHPRGLRASWWSLSASLRGLRAYRKGSEGLPAKFWGFLRGLRSSQRVLRACQNGLRAYQRSWGICRWTLACTY